MLILTRALSVYIYIKSDTIQNFQKKIKNSFTYFIVFFFTILKYFMFYLLKTVFKKIPSLFVLIPCAIKNGSF